jgi:hypothetical protein
MSDRTLKLASASAASKALVQTCSSTSRTCSRKCSTSGSWRSPTSICRCVPVLNSASARPSLTSSMRSRICLRASSTWRLSAARFSVLWSLSRFEKRSSKRGRPSCSMRVSSARYSGAEASVSSRSTASSGQPRLKAPKRRSISVASRLRSSMQARRSSLMRRSTRRPRSSEVGQGQRALAALEALGQRISRRWAQSGCSTSSRSSSARVWLWLFWVCWMPARARMSLSASRACAVRPLRHRAAGRARPGRDCRRAGRAVALPGPGSGRAGPRHRCPPSAGSSIAGTTGPAGSTGCAARSAAGARHRTGPRPCAARRPGAETGQLVAVVEAEHPASAVVDAMAVVLLVATATVLDLALARDGALGILEGAQVSAHR